MGSASPSNSYFSDIYRDETTSERINSRIKEIVNDSFDVVIDMPSNTKLSDSYYSDKLPNSITTSTLAQIKNILSHTRKEVHKNKFGNLGGKLKTQSPTSYWTI